MGACASKPKTLDGKAPVEAVAPMEAPKVAPEKVVEEANVEPPTAKLPSDMVMQKVEEEEEEKVEPKIIVEDKPSTLVGVNNTSVVVETIKVKNAEVIAEETLNVKNTKMAEVTTEVKNVEEEKPTMQS
ncbi:hypothetical protein ABZP36_011013 [Zizania latifolia]